MNLFSISVPSGSTIGIKGAFNINHVGTWREWLPYRAGCTYSFRIRDVVNITNVSISGESYISPGKVPFRPTRNCDPRKSFCIFPNDSSELTLCNSHGDVLIGPASRASRSLIKSRTSFCVLKLITGLSSTIIHIVNPP